MPAVSGGGTGLCPFIHPSPSSLGQTGAYRGNADGTLFAKFG